jgi:hypothetical protein
VSTSKLEIYARNKGEAIEIQTFRMTLGKFVAEEVNDSMA